MPDYFKAIGELLKLNALAGVRTYVAAAGLFGLSVSQFADANYDAAVASLMAALALVGIRAKLDDSKPDEPKS